MSGARIVVKLTCRKFYNSLCSIASYGWTTQYTSACCCRCRPVMCSLRQGQHVQHQCALADLMHEVSDIVNLLSPKARATVLGCNRQLRQLVHDRARTITVNSTKDVAALVKRTWLQLSLIIVKARFTRDYEWPANNTLQLLAELHVHGEWSTNEASQCWDARPRSWCGGWVFVVCPTSRI